MNLLIYPEWTAFRHGFGNTFEDIMHLDKERKVRYVQKWEKTMKPATAKLQNLVKNRHSSIKTNDTKKPQSIKEWINTDVKEWDTLISEDNKTKVNMNKSKTENKYKRRQQSLEKF